MFIVATSGIGPTFGNELIRANLSEGVSWTVSDKSVSVFINDDIAKNTDVLKAIQSLITAHDPTKVVDPVVPVSIPLYKAKIILAQTDMPDGSGKKILDAANDWIAAIQDPAQKQVATIAFTSAPDLYRNSVILAQVIAGLDLPEPLVDQMFIAAQALQM